MRERDQRDLLDQRVPERVDGLLDERLTGRRTARSSRPAAGPAAICAIRALTASMTSLVFTPVRATTTPPTASLRALHQRGDAKGVADLHVRDLFDVDRHAVRRADDDLLHVVDRGDQADAAHDQPGAVRLEHVAADIQVAVADRADHGAERQS